MDKIDFKTFWESTGEEFQARIERASYYKHPTGTGDAREDAVREYLKEILPPRFCVDRGKIFDSQGRLSKEFDIIISESIHVAPAMCLANRRIVPIEAVYGVLEVKSKLTQKEYNRFIESVIELDQMRRYYIPCEKRLSQEKLNELEKGFEPQNKKIGQIWSGVIAISAPKAKTICKYLESCCEGFWFICIPGREIVMQLFDPPGWIGVPRKLNSLPHMVWLMMDLVSRNTRPRYLMPNFSKYRESINNSFGDIKGAWRVEMKKI